MESKIVAVVDRDNKCYNIYGVIDGEVSYKREGITSNAEFNKEYKFLADMRGYKVLERYSIANGVKTFIDRKTWGSRFDSVCANN